MVSFFRAKGIRMVVYLDDMLFMHQNQTTLVQELSFVSTTLTSLGFIIDSEKSITQQTQQLEFLGMMLNSAEFLVSLPSKKLQKIITQSSKALYSKRIALRDLASLLDLLAWGVPAIPYAQSHYRHLQNLFIFNSQRSLHDLSMACALDEKAVAGLSWWVSSLTMANAKSFSTLPRTTSSMPTRVCQDGAPWRME